MKPQVDAGTGERDVACRVCRNPRLARAGAVHGYAFLACDACGFVFTPQVTAEGVASAYADGHHGPDEGVPESGWSKREAGFLAPALERLGPGPHRILDFGAGQSNTPDGLRAQGHRVIAVDVVPPVRPHPDRLTGKIEDLKLPGDAFDLAYAYQVMEHVPEPRPVLMELLRVVRPGGLVLLHTDMEVPERENGFENWWYVLPPDHCVFYRHRTFDALLAGTPHAVEWRDAKRVLIRVGGAGERVG